MLLGRIWDIKDTDDYLFPVCIDVQKNPKKNKRGYKKFTKYIRVLNCFDIFAEDGIDDDLVGKKTSISQYKISLCLITRLYILNNLSSII